MNAVYFNQDDPHRSWVDEHMPAPPRAIETPAIIHDLARKKAEELLLSHLTPEQRESFETNKWFIVRGGRSGAEYRVRCDGSLNGNIEALFGGRVVSRLCAHCDRLSLPMGDHLLAQKLMLEWDETEFMRIANRYPMHGE